MTRQSAAPAQNRLGAIASGTLPQDMLNMHFYGVFRKVELGGNQLIGKAELQRREYVLLAGCKVDHCLLGHNLHGAITLDYGWLRKVGACRYHLETRCFILSNNR